MADDTGEYLRSGHGLRAVFDPEFVHFRINSAAHNPLDAVTVAGTAGGQFVVHVIVALHLDNNE